MSQLDRIIHDNDGFVISMNSSIHPQGATSAPVARSSSSSPHLHLFTTENQSLLYGWNAFLHLNVLFYFLNLPFVSS